MKKAGRYTLGILFFLLIAELVVFGPIDLKEKKASSVKDIKSLVAKSADGNGDDSNVGQAMQGVHVIETKNESKEWELWADHALGMRDKDSLELSQVKAKFFAEHEVTFEVVGATGIVETELKNMVVDGGVITKSSNGYVFRTQKISYDSAKRVLRSETAVDVKGPKDQNGRSLAISGNTMTANLDQTFVLIEDNVKAKKMIKPDQYMAVTSQKVRLEGKDKSVRFLGNVIIDIDGMRISGPDAVFRYDSKSDMIETIDLDGGVKVSDMNKWATSDKLSINLAKNEYVFDGQPRVVQDNDELRGDRITFLEGGKKVKVQNAKIKVSKDTLGIDTNGINKWIV